MAFDPLGTDYDDEAVALTTSATVGVTTYYYGTLTYFPSGSLEGRTSPDYGAWTAVSKGGTRFTVNQAKIGNLTGTAGVPSESDSGVSATPDITLDPTTGRLWSTISQTVYVYYHGHGETDITATAADAEEVFLMQAIGFSDDGTTADLAWFPAPRNLRITEYCLVIPPNGGVAPKDNLSIQLRDAISGGGSAAASNMALTAGSVNSGWVAFSSPFSVAAAAVLAAYGDGQDAANLQIYLRHEPA